MLKTVLCLSRHPEDLDDGRVIGRGEIAHLVDVDHPHNARLLNEGVFVLAPETAETKTNPTIDEVLAIVGDDAAKAADALETEKASTKPRSTLIDKLEARIAELTPNPEEAPE